VIAESKPDFVIVGAMKCATSTLHEQLSRQPGFFMTTPKEPNFFSDDNIYAKGLNWYSSLFSNAGPSDIRGESSTHYTKLPTYPDALHRMHSALPGIKLIYVIRDPIDRLVSQYIHERTERTIGEPIDRALDRHPRLIDYSRYSMQIEPYLEVYGPENVLISFAERLSKQPQQELERVCQFLGYGGQPWWSDDVSRQNAGQQRLIRSPLRDAFVEMPVLRTIRRRFIPQTWRDRVKSYWQIKDRPQLSENSRRRLEEIFDADLARLGRWLGCELSCGSFRERAMTMSGEWAEARVPRSRPMEAEPARTS
jgi:hypothetical protein